MQLERFRTWDQVPAAPTLVVRRMGRFIGTRTLGLSISAGRVVLVPKSPNVVEVLQSQR
jgi:hypothetical protein